MSDLPLAASKARFIPISKPEIITDLLAASQQSLEEQQQFSHFCQLLTALYHYKFLRHSEALKRCYFPFNPDTDMVTRHEFSATETQQCHTQLLAEMRQLLNHANYEELTTADISHAITEESYYGVEVAVDLDDFAKMVIYYRGLSQRVEYKRTWKTLFLTQQPITITLYKRLFLLLKFKTAAERVKELIAINGPEFEKKARKLVRKSRQELPENLSEQHIFLKLFKDIPRSDLEMLFPNQRVRLKLFDKIKLSITGGGGTLAGIASVISKAGLALTNPIAFLSAFVGLIGIIVRQITGIFNQRTRYMMTLSRNLYFHCLDNNFGVIHYLLDMAEEEEGKEAILAYYFLATHPEKNYTKESLDQDIEQYLRNQYGIAINFEAEDGLRKLREEGILMEKPEGILTVLNPKEAYACVDKQWDAFFNA